MDLPEFVILTAATSTDRRLREAEGQRMN